MTAAQETTESPANTLCKACGLCCTGHLFIWTKLRSAELDAMEALGVQVLRSVPSQRGFNQPCPLWQGQCTVYDSEDYPRFCRTYKCKLLKKLLDEATTLEEALRVVGKAKGIIQELDRVLPDTRNPNFRERLSTWLETLETATGCMDREELELWQQALALLALYETGFGVDDVVERPREAG